MNDKRFKELLEKALAGSITEEEEKELLQDYIKPETAEVFPFIQLACDHKYTPAYYHLGNMYKKGIGCEKSIYLAWVQWMISVQNGGRGFAEIGDCYRLGAGCVEQNFNEAMKYYQKAVDNDEPRFRGISPDEWLSIPENLENDDLYEEYFIDEDPDDEDDEDWDDETSFECRCCHCRILREDVEDPETDICDDCRYSGNELTRD